jgi:hypothetical protein
VSCTAPPSNDDVAFLRDLVELRGNAALLHEVGLSSICGSVSLSDLVHLSLFICASVGTYPRYARFLLLLSSSYWCMSTARVPFHSSRCCHRRLWLLRRGCTCAVGAPRQWSRWPARQASQGCR